MQFEIRKFYRFQVPSGVISPSGIHEIAHFIFTQNTKTGEWLQMNPDLTTSLLPALPEDWIWTWLVSGRGEYVGTFPKRVSKYYYKVHGLKCPQSFIMQLGNLAKQHSEGQEWYLFDFTNRIDWEAGDFGDRGSCFWAGYAGAKVMIEENSGLAIRFYHDEQNGKGRAWLVPIEDNMYILFNGYGMGNNSTLTIARVFSLFVGLQYKQITLDNAYGGLYVNGNAGYIIGRIEQIDEIEDYQFEWDNIDATVCNGCGRVLDEDDTYYGADDEPYCQDCFDNRFSSCYHCGNAHYSEDLTYVESIGGDVCEWCIDRNFERCTRCDELFLIHTMERFGEALACRPCAIELRLQGDNIE